MLTPSLLSEFSTVALGYFANAAVFLLYGALTARSGVLLFALLPLCMVGSLSEPVLRHVFSQLVPASEQGVLQGALAALGTLPAWAFIGAVPLLTGLSGRCPAYSLFGFSTCPMKAAPEPPPGT
jgi:hypothetical protein